VSELRVVPRVQLGEQLGLVDADGRTSPRGVADLIRDVVHRCTMADRADILRFVRKQLDACGVEDTSAARSVLDRLIAIGDIAIGFVESTNYVMQSEPRWLVTGPSSGVILGARTVPEDLPYLEPLTSEDLVRRFRFDDEVRPVLEAAEIRHISIAEWLEPPSYLEFLRRRSKREVQGSTAKLEKLWTALVDDLAASGLPLSSDAAVRALVGPAGGYFGRFSSPEPEGRWSGEPTDGVWLGVRRGFNEAHWHPIILRVEGASRTALDLFDTGELWWAVLARGSSASNHEVVERAESNVRFTFPLPHQLRTAMDLLGPRTGAWSWKVAPSAQLPHEMLL
jgi:hypothetical protein